MDLRAGEEEKLENTAIQEHSYYIKAPAVCLHAQKASLYNQSCTVKLHAQQFYEQSWTSQVLEVGLSNYKIIHLIYISKYSK